jgi:hypothetical protein
MPDRRTLSTVPGGWIELRDPDDLTERQSRTVRAAFAKVSTGLREAMFTTDTGTNTAAAVTDGDIEQLAHINDLVTVAMVTAWSFPDPISCETLEAMKVRTYDEIQKLTAPFVGAFTLLNFEPDPSPDSPT